MLRMVRLDVSQRRGAFNAWPKQALEYGREDFQRDHGDYNSHEWKLHQNPCQ